MGRGALLAAPDSVYVDTDGLTNAGMLDESALFGSGEDVNGIGYQDTTPLHASSSRLSKASSIPEYSRSSSVHTEAEKVSTDAF